MVMKKFINDSTLVISSDGNKSEDGLKLHHVISNETLNFVRSVFRLLKLLVDVTMDLNMLGFCNSSTEIGSGTQ